MQQNKQVLLLATVLATIIASGLILMPALQDYADAQGKGQAKKADKVKPEKAKKEKPDKEKVKPEKEKEKAPKEDKQPKPQKQARFEVIIDGSQVGNLTDALLNYQFSVAANGLVSKSKQLDTNLTGVDDISNMMIVFNAKNLNLTDGDTFSATATATTDAYVSDTVTGTFVSEEIGKSGKTRMVGTTDEPLVLADVGQEVEEQIPDDFAQLVLGFFLQEAYADHDTDSGGGNDKSLGDCKQSMNNDDACKRQFP